MLTHPEKFGNPVDDKVRRRSFGSVNVTIDSCVCWKDRTHFPRTDDSV